VAGLLNMLRVVFLSVFSIVGLLFFEAVLFLGNFVSLCLLLVLLFGFEFLFFYGGFLVFFVWFYCWRLLF
jgi:hypothetical protein